MNWDDLRYVAALARHGSLAKTAAHLGVEHTTVGRRVDAAERSLGLGLFTRTPAGYLLTQDGEQLVSRLQAVEDAVLELERGVRATADALHGTVRVTSPETLGIAYLASRLARFAATHPALRVDLLPAGKVLDLSRSEAELALRTFRTKHERLVVRRVGDVGYRLYASRRYLARRPAQGVADLGAASLLVPTDGPELAWLQRLVPGLRPAFVSEVSLALAQAALADAGLAALPRYLGDSLPELVPVPLPGEPSEPLYLTVHRDLRATPRVRAVADFLVTTLAADRRLLGGP